MEGLASLREEPERSHDWHHQFVRVQPQFQKVNLLALPGRKRSSSDEKTKWKTALHPDCISGWKFVSFQWRFGVFCFSGTAGSTPWSITLLLLSSSSFGGHWMKSPLKSSHHVTFLKGQAIFGMSGVVASYSLGTDRHVSLAATGHLVLTGIWFYQSSVSICFLPREKHLLSCRY